MQDSQFNYEYYNEYNTYLESLGEDNTKTRTVLMKNLRTAVKEDITDRQWQLLRMYYVEQIKMPEIARMLGINISTVSRTISRGRARLYKCLRYGARELLSPPRDNL